MLFTTMIHLPSSRQDTYLEIRTYVEYADIHMGMYNKLQRCMCKTYFWMRWRHCLKKGVSPCEEEMICWQCCGIMYSIDIFELTMVDLLQKFVSNVDFDCVFTKMHMLSIVILVKYSSWRHMADNAILDDCI